MGLKECPVCHARCFDDMDVCYGCLHSFSRDGADRSASARPTADQAPVDCRPANQGGAERALTGPEELGGRGASAAGKVHGACAPASPEATCDVAARPAVSVSCVPGADALVSPEEGPEARAAAASRVIHVLDIVIGIRMAQDAAERAAAATLPVWVEQADANDGWIVSER